MRYPSIDIIRGLAILAMVEAHIPFKVGDLNATSAIFAAPVFLIVSGIGYELLINSRKNKGLPETTIFLEVFGRSLILAMITIVPFYIASILMPSEAQFKILYWSVFQVIAFGYVLSYSCSVISRKLDQPWILVLLVFAITILIKSYFALPFSTLIEGTFPILPYIAYFLFGRALAPIYGRTPAFMDKLLVYSVVFFAIGLCLFILFDFDFSRSARVELPMFLLLCCVSLLLLILLIKHVDFGSRENKLTIPLERTGRIAFSAYYLHLAIIYILFKPIANMAILSTLGVAICNVTAVIGTILLLAHVEAIWARYSYTLSLEQLLRDGSAKFVAYSERYIKRSS